MYKIFIVEDDPVIAAQLQKYIASWGFETRCAQDFRQVTAEFAAFGPHLVLMDIMLPFYNGYHWCTELRRLSQVPIMFLSSASDNMNIVMAMNMGGDDFIAKPFDPDVLTAKIQALLRRSYDFGPSGRLMEHRGAIFDPERGSLTFGGRSLDLTRNDSRILRTLLENKGRTVSRETLMNRLWETDCFIDENTLTVNVTRLRRKLEQLGLTDFITTVKGTGYMVK